MTIFFTSDTHFDQVRTLELSKRPFRNVFNMNHEIINKWNATVGLFDTVYHLGDFGSMESLMFLNHLYGNIRFLPGNYDTPEMIERIAKTCEIIKPNTNITAGRKTFQLVHKPVDVIGNDFFLFGHIHKLQMVKRNGLNVGIDCHNYFPISLETVLFYRNAIEEHYDENVFCGNC